MKTTARALYYGLAFFGALVAGQAIHWFISPANHPAASTMLKVAVIAQLAAGVAVWIWAALKARRAPAL